MSLPLLVVLLGPTASGKTALSLHLAERLQGEIVSCDSVAVYREFEIGTAKPSLEERRRVPHHLIDIVGPEEAITAGDYSRLARQAVGEIAARGHLPIVVGGSGLYLRALLEGLFSGPPRSEALRARLRERAAERGQIICIGFSAASTQPPRKLSTPMTFPRLCERWKSASAHALR